MSDFPSFFLIELDCCEVKLKLVALEERSRGSQPERRDYGGVLAERSPHLLIGKHGTQRPSVISVVTRFVHIFSLYLL